MERTPDEYRGHGAEISSLWIVAASLYFGLAASMIYLTSNHLTVAAVWPANAVLVALLLIGPKPRWGVVLSAGLLGNLAANSLTRGTVSGSFLYSLANCLEVIVAVVLIQANVATLGKLRATGRLLRFVAAAGVAAPLASGIIGASTAAAVYGQPFGEALMSWLLSDSLGLLVFTPVFVSIFNGDVVAYFHRETIRKRAEAITLFIFTAAIAWIVFFVSSLPALFLLYAPVMLVTFRVGPLGTKVAVMIIAVIGAYATAIGTGPVAMMTADPAAQAHMFQASLAVMLLTCLPVAAEIAERCRISAELATRERQANEEAVTDQLTGLLNRRGFERLVRTALADRTTELCYVAIDIDRFKSINDQWGHQFGDEVLQQIAAVLRANLRPGDLAGRLGGDEFALMLRIHDRHSAEAVCKRIQAALRASPLSPDAKTGVMVSISCGAAALVTGDRIEDAYRRADSALYDAKVAGRNTIRSAETA